MPPLRTADATLPGAARQLKPEFHLLYLTYEMVYFRTGWGNACFVAGAGHDHPERDSGDGFRCRENIVLCGPFFVCLDNNDSGGRIYSIVEDETQEKILDAGKHKFRRPDSLPGQHYFFCHFAFEKVFVMC